MIRTVLLLTAVAKCAIAVAPSAASIASEIRQSAFDPDECYRVRDLNFSREDIKFFLSDGFLIFSKPVVGRRLTVLFASEVEDGDAEVIVMPPHRSDRQSLSTFTGAPNLSEHFKSAIFVFADGSAEELLVRAREAGKKQPERGALLANQYSRVASNVSESLQLRLVEDLLNGNGESALFYGIIAGAKLGNFDVILDSRSREQVLLGQLTSVGGSGAFDTWASFQARSARNGGKKHEEPNFAVSDYRIDASLDDALHMTAVTRLKVTPARGSRALLFQVSDRVKVNEVRVNGQAVEIFARESLRTNANRPAGTGLFLVVTPEALAAGKDYELEFRHEGDVVMDAGNGVYAVTSRGTWYPYRGGDFSKYDLTFRYPKRLQLVSTGELIEDKTDGEFNVTHRRTSAPVRFAGFNLGDYERVAMTRGGYSIEVYGNRRIEPSLEAKPVITSSPQGPMIGRRPRVPEMTVVVPMARAGSRLGPLANEVAGAFEFMTKQFGPPPLKTLTVSPIPGAFGQGFPGLVYLSTLAYLQAEERPAAVRDAGLQSFFSDMLAPHEVAHQWWGNLVTSDDYQDVWITESLANYSALLYLEKRKGVRALESVLDVYRKHLLQQDAEGKTVESTGPLTWGARLEGSRAGGAWRTIEYEKGAWVMHMLRRRMGDEAFFKMLTELCKRFAFQPASTDALRLLAEEFMAAGKGSLADFFETWVYGTGVPALKLTSSVKGKIPAVKITAALAQSEVDDEFAAEVPLEFQFAGGPPIVKWVRTGSEAVSVTVNAKRMPTRVVIAPYAVLSRK